MNETEIRGDIAAMCDAFKKMTKVRPSTAEHESLEIMVTALAEKVATQVIVDVHRIADALENSAMVASQALELSIHR